MATKATLYLDSTMYKTMKLRALESNQSVSSLINDALQAQLAEDLEDISVIRERLAKNEKPLDYEQALIELQKNGVI